MQVGPVVLLIAAVSLGIGPVLGLGLPCLNEGGVTTAKAACNVLVRAPAMGVVSLGVMRFMA